jgi:RNA polymerase sigma-70 factor, ECF subfamily
METSPREQVTRILDELGSGHPSAAERLFPLIYDEMRLLAGQFFKRERSNHTLQPTALVHEAYLRLVENTQQWEGRAHFYAVAARVMRRILINHAAAHRAEKRGGGSPLITLSEGSTPAPGGQDVDLLALDEALTRLEALDERQCRVVELRFFSGMSVEETAGVLGVSARTVELDWKMARAWLFSQLGG